MHSLELLQRKHDITPAGVGVMADFFVERARNAELWDQDGRRYIDFAGGIGALNTGHLHPRVHAAVAKQLDAFSHTAYQIVPYALYLNVAEKLNALAPIKGAAKSAFFTTGAEAVENAVKIARAATGRPGLIAFGGGFHGRTLLGMSLTGKVAPYKTGFGPFPADIYHAPFPDAQEGVSLDDALKGLERLFKYDIDPARVAAFILEPVQGEGGIRPAPQAFMQALREIADQHGILIIADEVQCGFGRTGKLFAMEHYDAEADIITLAKSLAGGFPLSAIVGRAAVMDAPVAGSLGGTYAGNPLALAAADAVIDIMRDENLPDRAEALGTLLADRLDGLKKCVPQLAEVRRVGGMVGLEFRDGEGRPDVAFMKKVQAGALARGLILIACGLDGNVIRCLFPLTIEFDVFDEALAIFEAALLEASA
ncbi:4-aminobutyrate--2-oxoglutarate transaminase [Crenobacter cavernae]|uniref:4-aminobutyrate--2-oxoglutarate transaminase n=1 Tax=Crenobacter cavernae TaxID=2290923 RepID=A0A345Y3F5_9NEIS|nr:4-aminobutyrate--2-oxoglutarate transaminase [Crenobacter cavernae]AXK38457.1 4-aminobutyrate--2-oxoglutarate transaminase [Crenobacter cavernae]